MDGATSALRATMRAMSMPQDSPGTVAMAAVKPGGENWDRGDASRLRPSHTTGHAGPHPAVRRVELSVHSQAWNPERVEVSIRQRDESSRNPGVKQLELGS